MTRNDIKKLITDNSDNAICIWMFNVDLDVRWDQQTLGFFPRTDSTDKMNVFGMEQIMLMLANKNDIVIMRSQPNEIICNNIKELYNGLPTILVPSNIDNNQNSISEIVLTDKKIIAMLKNVAKTSKTYLVPYAITEHEHEIAELIGSELVGPTYNLASWINSKITARNISKELKFDTTFGIECHSPEELSAASEIIQNKYPNIIMVLKEEYGASGKGLFFIKGKNDWDLAIYRANKLQNNNKIFNVILEKWYSVKENVNYQLIISDNTFLSKKYAFCISKQTIINGIYRGSIFVKSNSELNKLYEPYTMSLGDYLYSKGYRGICNVDSIITETNQIIPIVEINGRFSLSTYVSCVADIVPQNMYIVSAYYDIDSKITLQEIDNSINCYRYNVKSKSGIFIYSFSSNTKNNRLFCLFIYPDKNDAYKKKIEFENILEIINMEQAERSKINYE